MIKNKPYPYYKVKWVDNLKDFLGFCEKEHKNKVAFEYENGGQNTQKTFREFSLEVKALASYFIKNSIQNQKIAVLGENSYEWILTYFGVVTSNNVIVPIDKDLSIEEIKLILKQTNITHMIISDTYSDYEKNIAVEEKIDMINMKIKLPMIIKEGLQIYEKNNKIYDENRINGNSVSTIIYTSGTTGNPKGVVLTHNNICKNVVSGMESFEMTGNSILILPLHHTYAFSGAMLCVMYSGCKNYINKSLKNLPADLEKQNPTFLLAVPLIVETFYKKIWKGARESKKAGLLKFLIIISNILLFLGIDVRKRFFKSVRKAFGGELYMIICGGAAIDKRYIKGFRDFGVDILVGYGITECSPFVSVNRNKYYKDGSIGQPLSCSTVKIEKFEGKKEGEILVKGDMVMKEYYHNPELTQQVIENEYFKTGDIGYIDNKGFIFITGRKKNIIILANGKNVYPEEVEFELLKNESIQEVIVYGEDDRLVAEIYPNNDIIKGRNVADIKQYFDKEIEKYNKKQPAHKKIAKIILRDNEFEKTTSKKIKRAYKESK